MGIAQIALFRGSTAPLYMCTEVPFQHHRFYPKSACGTPIKGAVPPQLLYICVRRLTFSTAVANIKEAVPPRGTHTAHLHKSACGASLTSKFRDSGTSLSIKIYFQLRIGSSCSIPKIPWVISSGLTIQIQIPVLINTS